MTDYHYQAIGSEVVVVVLVLLLLNILINTKQVISKNLRFVIYPLIIYAY